MADKPVTESRHTVIVIGAGQAGLAIGALLEKAGLDYLIVGAEQRVGDIWRNRYESLRLFTPRWLNRLPQDNEEHPERNGYPDKDEVADYLARYASNRQLNVKLNTRVNTMRREGRLFILETSSGQLAANTVVVATGPFQNPRVPDFADRLSADVFQVHTAHYRNEQQLAAGNVVVVGGGNSGAQIAVELCDTRTVHLSASGPISFMPQALLGKSIFWWFQRMGIYRAHINTVPGRRLSQRPDPVIGRDLQRCLARGRISQLPRVVDAKGRELVLADGSRVAADNVIWATGFQPDYSWLQVPGVLGAEGRPDHKRGVTNVSGLFFLGLPWQYSRKSALIGGVGDDALHVMSALVRRLI